MPGWVDPASLLGLFLWLLATTWLRWPDALVDFWRNLYIPWRMSEGALLYVDVADGFGPLPSLVAAAAFAVVGPGLQVLVVLDALVALACLAALHAALRRVGDRFSAWVGGVVFLLAFCFAQYVKLGNYNYLTPYVAQATWGFLGVLLTLDGALANATEEDPAGWLLAGVGLAIAWLTKVETAFTAGVVLAAVLVLRRRWPPGRVLVGFAAVGAPVLALLAAEGGPGYAFTAFSRAALLTFSPRMLAILREVPIVARDLGTQEPLAGLGAELLHGAAALGVVAAVALASEAWRRSRALTLALGAGAIAALLATTDWLRVGRSLPLPALVAGGLAGLAVIRGHRQWAPLGLLSLAAVAMLARMILNARIFHYGFTMAVLAAMLLVHLLVFEAPRWRAPSGLPRSGLRLAAAALVLGGSARLAAFSLEGYGAKALAVGQGADAFLAQGSSKDSNAVLVAEMLDAVERHAPGARTLVAFPDSAALSYLSRRPSPIPEFEFNPMSLAYAGTEDLLRRLAASPPDAVLLCSYDLRIYGSPAFGATEASGQAIARWLREHYVTVAAGPRGPHSITGHTWDLLLPRPPEPPR